MSVSILDFPELKTGDRHFSRLMDYLLDTDRQMRRKKQVNGMQRARDGGKRLGRKPKAIPDRFGEVYGEYEAGNLSARDAAGLLDVSHTTFLRWCRREETRKAEVHI